MTREGDVVLVYLEDNPAFFARVEAITADVKAGWYQMKMLVLQVPLLVITWILRETYINGDEFTMGGKPVRVVKVVAPAGETGLSDLEETPEREPEVIHPEEKVRGGKNGEAGKVVSLADRRKKDQSP